MRCARFQRLVVDFARNVIDDPQRRQEMAAHAAGCAACAAALREQQSLSQSLRQLAAAGEQIASLRDPESTALAAWKAVYPDQVTLDAAIPAAAARQRAAWTRTRSIVVGGLLAACVVQVIVPVLKDTGRGQMPAVRQGPPLGNTDANDGAGGTDRSVPAADLAGGLVLLVPDAVDAQEPLFLVRMQLSDLALASLGLGARPPSGELVTAEVLVGEDGIARAIRIPLEEST